MYLTATAGEKRENKLVQLREAIRKTFCRLNYVNYSRPHFKTMKGSTNIGKLQAMSYSSIVSDSSQSYETSSNEGGDHEKAIAKGGVTTPFPWKLHEMLDDIAKGDDDSIVCWQPHGRAFMVHKPKEFVSQIMAKYFNQTKYASFQRQLNLYGFSRLSHGLDKGAYYHKCFVRGQRKLCRGMVRLKIKGTKVRRSLSPEEEPNFYAPEYNQTKTLVKKHQMSPPLSSITTSKVVVKKKSHSPPKSQANKITTDLIIHPAPTSLIEMFKESQYPLSPKSLIPNQPMIKPRQGPRTPQVGVRPQVIPSTSSNHVKGGDLLYFEGCPFHYLEHLEEVPATPNNQFFQSAIHDAINNIVAMESTPWQSASNGQGVFSQ